MRDPKERMDEIRKRADARIAAGKRIKHAMIGASTTLAMFAVIVLGVNVAMSVPQTPPLEPTVATTTSFGADTTASFSTTTVLSTSTAATTTQATASEPAGTTADTTTASSTVTTSFRTQPTVPSTTGITQLTTTVTTMSLTTATTRPVTTVTAPPTTSATQPENTTTQPTVSSTIPEDMTTYPPTTSTLPEAMATCPSDPPTTTTSPGEDDTDGSIAGGIGKPQAPSHSTTTTTGENIWQGGTTPPYATTTTTTRSTVTTTTTAAPCEGTVVCSVSNVHDVSVGDVITVDIVVSDGHYMTEGQFDIWYDPDALALLDLYSVNTSVLPASHHNSFYTVAPDHARFLFGSIGMVGHAKGGTAFTLTFEVLDGIRDGTTIFCDVSNMMSVDGVTNGGNPYSTSVVTVDGTVTPAATVTDDGWWLYSNRRDFE